MKKEKIEYGPSREIKNSLSFPEEKDIFYNLVAETDIIGGLLFDNNSFNSVGEFLRKHHFYSPLHGLIYEVIEVLINKRRVAEPLTVSNNLQSESLFLENGGQDYLYNILQRYAQSSFTISLLDRGKLIEGLYYERKLLDVLQESRTDLQNKTSGEEPYEKIEKLEKALYDLTQEAEKGKGGFISLSNLFTASVAHIKKSKETGGVRGIPIGFSGLDYLLGGFQKSDLIIVAARPAMGKSSFAIALAINAAKFLMEEKGQKKESIGSIGVFSLEMAGEQLSTRMLSVFSGVNSAELLNGKLDNEELKTIVKTAEEFKELPIYIDETPAITINALKTRARRLKKQSGLDMIIIDYLQLLRAGGKQENRVQEISEITQGLKAIAKELNIPVIALSQLSRNVESREDKRPQLQDLRESGSIEQDADIVMFLYREEYYLERSIPGNKKSPEYDAWAEKNGLKFQAVRNIAEIIVAKHRNGPVGTVSLRFDKETTKFSNLDKTFTQREGLYNEGSQRQGGYISGDPSVNRKAFEERLRTNYKKDDSSFT